MRITWGSTRELNKYDFDIKQYYKNLTDAWNKLSDYISEPTDRRKNYCYAYRQFFEELLYMWDMINQTQKQHETLINDKNKRIQVLEKELNKWTEQQQGRKSKITSQEREQIRNWSEKGMSNRAIALKFNVSEGTIRNILKKLKNVCSDERTDIKLTAE